MLMLLLRLLIAEYHSRDGITAVAAQMAQDATDPEVVAIIQQILRELQDDGVQRTTIQQAEALLRERERS